MIKLQPRLGRAAAMRFINQFNRRCPIGSKVWYNGTRVTVVTEAAIQSDSAICTFSEIGHAAICKDNIRYDTLDN